MRIFVRFGLFAAALLTIVGSVIAAPGASLEPGDPAPALAVKSWYKGAPVTAFSDDKIYVVEFWATWCGPCIQSIPHLTELAKKNPDVDFIGVSIWEDDKDQTIPKFIAQMGDKMDYHVGYSGNQDGMAQTWMAAAGQNGIPTAFIIKGGHIEWVGHPMAMEPFLDQVKSGTFNLDAFKKDFDVKAAENRKRMELQKEIVAIGKQFDDGDHQGAKAKLDAFEKANPDQKQGADMMRFEWLAKEDPAAWETKAKQLAGSTQKEDRQTLLSFALRQTREHGNVDQGRQAISLVLKATGNKDFLTLNYAEAFYGEIKDYKSQLDMVNQMLQVLPSTEYKDNAQLLASLQKTKDEVEGKLKDANHN